MYHWSTISWFKPYQNISRKKGWSTYIQTIRSRRCITPPRITKSTNTIPRGTLWSRWSTCIPIQMPIYWLYCKRKFRFYTAWCQSCTVQIQDDNVVSIIVMCVATGCDYCQSLRGIGLVLARNCVHEASRKVMSSRLKSRSSTTTNATTTTTCSLIGETLKLLFEKSCRGDP